MSTIFITAATGLQGTHLCQVLLEQNWTIHATTRKISSPSAKYLLSLGVHLTEGDWNNTTALQSSIQGCTHLFLNLMPDISGGNLDSELPHAKTILSIAQEAGLKHIVYSSAFGSGIRASSSTTSSSTSNDAANTSDCSDPFADLTSLHSRIQRMKSDIEHLVSHYDPPFATFTILRPAFFMANMLSPRANFMYPGLLVPTTSPSDSTQQLRTWKTALLPNTKIPMVDPLDIARCAAAALQSPHDCRYNGQIIPVYNELLTPAQLLATLEESVNRALNQQETQWQAEFDTEAEIQERKEANDIMVHVQLHMRKIGDGIEWTGEEIQDKWKVTMGTFSDYLTREKDLVIKTYGAVKEGAQAVPAGGYIRK